MDKTVAQIAASVNGQVLGDPGLRITGFSGIKEAREGDLAFLANSKYFSLLKQTRATAVIVPPDVDPGGKTVICTENPSYAFSQVIRRETEGDACEEPGIHPTAVIGPEVVLEDHVSVGPYTVIEKGARIGSGTRIHSGCFIGRQSVVGKNGLIYANVSIREKIRIGHRVIIHSGSVIGSDGFGFVNIDGSHEKIPQIGIVEIGDNVEIGANVTIDRARFDKTVIGSGTKIDNLVQIAHNVCIGRNCIIVSQVGISGSTVIEDNVILAGQAGIAGHLTVGEGSIVASKSGVPKSIPPKTMVWGNPAKPHLQAKRVNACVQKLPEHVKQIRELKEKVEALEKKMARLSQDGVHG